MSGISPNETLIDFLGRKPQPLPQPGIMPISDDPVRQEYNRLKKEAADKRAGGFMGQVVLPTEGQTFEEYEKGRDNFGNLLKANAAQPTPNNSIEPIDPIRLEYNRLKKEAADKRANGFMGRVVLPTEGQTFEDFRDERKNSISSFSNQPPLKTNQPQPNLSPMRPAHSGPHLPNNPMNPINKIPYTSIGQPLKQPLPLIAGTPIGEPANPGFNINTGLSLSSTTLNKPTQPQVYGGK